MGEEREATVNLRDDIVRDARGRRCIGPRRIGAHDELKSIVRESAPMAHSDGQDSATFEARIGRPKAARPASETTQHPEGLAVKSSAGNPERVPLRESGAGSALVTLPRSEQFCEVPQTGLSIQSACG